MKIKTAAAFCLALTPAMAAAQTLTPIGRYETGAFDEGAAEIVDYDPASQRLFVVNGETKGIDILDFSDPTSPTKIGDLDLSAHGAGANSVAVHDGVVVAAVEAEEIDGNGVAAIFSAADGAFLRAVEICVLPDMAAITPNGQHAVIACEGEPSDDMSVDPEGGVAIVDIAAGTAEIADFGNFDESALVNGLRIGRPGATLAQDMEPEYVTITADSAFAAVTMQENNGVAIVDIANAEITSIVGLGYKNHAMPGNGFDASDKDGEIKIQNWPVLGMYMPDSIDRFTVAGVDYLVTANEGDSRDYDGFSEEVRVEDLTLDATVFPNAEELQKPENLGRLKTTTTSGDFDGDGDHDVIFAYGTRSFTIWSANGAMIWDSGDALERITAEAHPENFNATNDENGSFDNRSDDKGPEPEAIETGVVDGKPMVFVGLERIGGVMVYDVSNPVDPAFVTYVNTRDFAGDAEAGTAGDLAPEGFKFISSEDSPNGENLLVAGFEVSGTVVVFQID